MTIQLRKFIEAFIVIVILAFIIMQFASCSSKAQQAGGWNEGPVSISTTTVALTNASYTNNYPGTVVPLNSVELRAQVSGYITGIYFQDGDRVRKGQKLYSIDAQLYTANYEQAQANLQLQETNLLKAQKDADRYHELEKNDAIAKQQVDYADAALAAAQKQVAAAQANVKSLQTGVNYTTIYAPFDGTIGISQVKTGTAVTAGVTLLNVVSTDDPMAVDFTIDQKEIYRFSLLDKKGAKTNDSTFSIRFGEKDVYPAFGKINFLDRAVDPQTGTLKVRLEFPNKENVLRAGMNCTVQVANDNNSPVVVIPTKALTEQLGDYFVYVVEGNKVTQHKVVPGTYVGNDVIINDGLKGGEVIAVEGVQKLHEGSTVQTGAEQAKK